MPVTDRWTQFLNFLRGSVRPLVTYAVIGVLCFITYKVIIQFASEQLALMVAGAFLSLVSAITGFWFATRSSNPKA